MLGAQSICVTHSEGITADKQKQVLITPPNWLCTQLFLFKFYLKTLINKYIILKSFLTRLMHTLGKVVMLIKRNLNMRDWLMIDNKCFTVFEAADHLFGKK